MVPRAARRLGLNVEAKAAQVQQVDKRIDCTNRIVLVDIVVDALRQEGGLASIQTFDKAFHESPRSQRWNHTMLHRYARVFTQPLCFADDPSVDAIPEPDIAGSGVGDLAVSAHDVRICKCFDRRQRRTSGFTQLMLSVPTSLLTARP